jgi:hypothetical protein
MGPNQRSHVASQALAPFVGQALSPCQPTSSPLLESYEESARTTIHDFSNKLSLTRREKTS